MALPLIESGKYEVHLIANRHTSFAECYNTFIHWIDLGQVNNAIKLHKDADIFHVHNEPSWFVTLIKEICDTPVVLDVHDSFLARCTPEEASTQLPDGTHPVRISVEERNNFDLADALVFPGQRFRDLVVGEFKLSQKDIVLRSHVPRRMYRYTMQDWFGGLVYEGKVQLETNTRASYGFKYCDYYDLAKECYENKLPFHLYGGRDDDAFVERYGEYAIVHKPEVFDVLLRKISAHDWGLVGNIHKTYEWDNAMPNKLFEYIAAGVPIVALNAGECGEYVKEHGIGIEVKSLKELMERWGEHRAIRRNLLKTRAKFSMEENIKPLEELYASL